MEIEQWPLAKPFRITGKSFEVIEVLTVTLGKDGYVGRAEASGIYYLGDSGASMARQLEQVRARIEESVSRDLIQEILAPGGARNALDCAFWDLEAQLTSIPAWQTAGLQSVRPLLTTYTCGADEPLKMAAQASAYVSARAIKLKLLGEPMDAERVLAVREARPDVWLGVDANQGFTRQSLESLISALVQARVELIEQPFPIGREAWLDGLDSPIPIAADESVQRLTDMATIAGRFDVVNIKLDKCGGLTEALAMARAAQDLGLQAMVGNMMGTSLGMAPAWVVGQLCSIVDLDGPIFLKADRPETMQFSEGYTVCPADLWGGFARRSAAFHALSRTSPQAG